MGDSGGKCELESEVRSTARAGGGLELNNMCGRAAAVEQMRLSRERERMQGPLSPAPALS